MSAPPPLPVAPPLPVGSLLFPTACSDDESSSNLLHYPPPSTALYLNVMGSSKTVHSLDDEPSVFDNDAMLSSNQDVTVRIVSDMVKKASGIGRDAARRSGLSPVSHATCFDRVLAVFWFRVVKKQELIAVSDILESPMNATSALEFLRAALWPDATVSAEDFVSYVDKEICSIAFTQFEILFLKPFEFIKAGVKIS
jgi:hypothetical protein